MEQSSILSAKLIVQCAARIFQLLLTYYGLFPYLNSPDEGSDKAVLWNAQPWEQNRGVYFNFGGNDCLEEC